MIASVAESRSRAELSHPRTLKGIPPRSVCSLADQPRQQRSQTKTKHHPGHHEIPAV